MKRRIVVVEDEPGISLPIRDELASQGFAVELAEDGVSGLEAILREQPDLVVLDLMLPGMGGLDVCKELRRHRIDVPVIMLSARGQEIDRVVGLEVGADDYMTKPFSLRELVARIRVRLRRVEQGDALARYRLTEQIGAGGMGVVYKARDLRLERWVALKFLSSGLAVDADSRERFFREARAASCLDHPNIATIYGIEETGAGRLFIAMAYYEGETLKQTLEAGPLALETALDLARQAAAGLAHAHEHVLVHRDIKPANLLVTRAGVVKIVDFGIAKLIEPPDITTTRPIWGTPAYVAPEQARGEPADARADVYSLGRVLHEMVMGRLPDLDVSADFTPHLRLERIFARALAPDPARRYASAREMLLDLASC